MFGRYALAVGRGAHRNLLERRARWLGYPPRIQTPELLLVTSNRCHCVHEAGAILIGQLFDVAGERLSSIPPALARTCSRHELRTGLDQHWGNFALFYGLGENYGAYREPSGSVPVYRYDQLGGTIFLSDAEFAAKLGIVDDATIDTRFVVHWLQFPFLRSARTGIEQVTELLPGMLMTRDGAAHWSETQIWHPSHFATQSQAIADPAEAARQLRETALLVVAKQSNTDAVVLRLSGGLDSSIIAACLAQANVDFSCINFATRARDGDEREYARSVANSLGVKLIEIAESQAVELKQRGQLAFRPITNPLVAPVEQAIAEAAGGLGASVLIDGGGGDNLFYAITSAAPVIDALQWSGLHDAHRAAVDIAARANCTIWEVLKAVGRRLLKRHSSWSEDKSFIVPGALLYRPELHPWLEGLRVPQGKHEQVKALVHIQHFLDRGSHEIELLHPLLAQPLLELCLRIPSWFWVREGRDRAIARDAFTGLVPESVLQRRMKGSLQSFLYRSFAQLRDPMAELLRSGHLCQMGILDHASISSALTGNAWTTDEVQLRLSEMVALEFWLQSWRSRPTAANGS